MTEPIRNKPQFNNVLLGESKSCAASSECFTNNKKTAEKKKWIAEHDLYMTSFGRVMVKIKDAWMDAVTGSFYDADGRCRSSTNLSLGEVWKDQEAAAKQLMQLSPDRVGII